MNNVSVIIPNFNGQILLAAYLPTVDAALHSCPIIQQYEIIIVDDASTDDSVAYIEQNWHTIRIIRNKQNRGFSCTVNRGIQQAKYELVCILNTDMQLPTDYFTVLLPMVSQPNVFGVNCAIKDPKTSEIVEGRKQAIIRHHKLTYKDLLSEQEEGETMYLCGGNALICKEKLISLGGYDELFSPFYFEDMDLSLRAKQQGWISLYTARTSCVHQHAATIGKTFTTEQVKEIFLRNRVYINLRYLTGITRVLFLLSAYFHALKEKVFRLPWSPYRKALFGWNARKNVERAIIPPQ